MLGLILERLRLPNPAWPSKRRGACRIVACGHAPIRSGVAVDTPPLASQAEDAPLRARQALRAIMRLRMGARCCSTRSSEGVSAPRGRAVRDPPVIYAMFSNWLVIQSPRRHGRGASPEP